MVKHFQTTCWLLPTNSLSVLDRFKGLALKELIKIYSVLLNYFCVESTLVNTTTQSLLLYLLWRHPLVLTSPSSIERFCEIYRPLKNDIFKLGFTWYDCYLPSILEKQMFISK